MAHANSPPSKNSGPLAAAVGRLGEIGTGFLEDRAELLSLDLQEGKIRLLQAVMLICAATVFCTLGLALLAGLLVYLLPPGLRPRVLLVLGLVSTGLGVLAFCGLRSHFRQERRPLAATLAELKKDVSCFSTKN